VDSLLRVKFEVFFEFTILIYNCLFYLPIQIYEIFFGEKMSHFHKLFNTKIVNKMYRKSYPISMH